MLKLIHAAKDKRLLRTLATITTPADSANARKRAQTKLPDLTKHISTAASEWTAQLVNRWSMGDALNSKVVHSYVSKRKILSMCKHLLGLVNLPVGFFPRLDYPSEAIEGLTVVFSKCRSANSSTKKKLENSIFDVSLTLRILGIALAGKDGLSPDLMQL